MKKYIGIISVSLSGIGIYIFDKVWGNKINWGKLSELPIGKLLSKQISVLSILIFISLSIVMYLVLRKFLKNDYYNRKQKKLRRFNKMKDPQNGLLFKWEVFFDYNKPFIAELEIYCTKHGEVPLRFYGSGCADNNCSNFNANIDEYKLKNYIESLVIDKWEKIKLAL